MNFVGAFRLDRVLCGSLTLRVPNHRPVFLFDSVENVRRSDAPASIWKNCVSERELGKRYFAAAKQRRRIRSKRGTESRVLANLQNFIQSSLHSKTHRCAVL